MKYNRVYLGLTNNARSNQEKNISEEYSSLVNKAYDIIQTPLKRAIHLLSLKGEEVREGHEIDDPEFLMEIMELNEEVCFIFYLKNILFFIILGRKC